MGSAGTGDLLQRRVVCLAAHMATTPSEEGGAMNSKEARKVQSRGNTIQLLACVLAYPAFQAFYAGLVIYGLIIVAVMIAVWIIGRRILQRGLAEDPGNMDRRFDHREKRDPNDAVDPRASNP